MSMLDWAKREVEIACKKENPNRKEGEWDYGCACYESALKAFESLCGDGHSGFSIKMTQQILNRMIDGQPLTPIEDTDDIWNECSFGENGEKQYQCKRMSSLFKTVYPDGHVEYNDVDQFACIDINDPSCSYHSGLVGRVMKELFPITMPHMPGKPTKVYCEDLLTDPKNGDFDTVGIFYAVKEENGEVKRIEIGRYFRAPFEGEESETGWVEIDKEEYEKRAEMHHKRLKDLETN